MPKKLGEYEGKTYWELRIILSQREYDLFAEILATAILRSDDETGEFVPEVRTFVSLLKMDDKVADHMATIVRRAEGRLEQEPHRRG